MALLLPVSIVKNSRSLINLSVIILFLFSCSQRQQTEEPAPPRPAHIDPNPSPGFLSPEESMKTMKLPPGYHMELVASEPQIQEPVAITAPEKKFLFVALHVSKTQMEMAKWIRVQLLLTVSSCHV